MNVLLKPLVNSAVRILLFMCVSVIVVLITPIMCVVLLSVAFYGIIVMPVRARFTQP